MNKNCLRLIRLFAALQVFIVHSYAHLHIELPLFFKNLFSIIQGVPVFFLLSGFLIWNSLNQDDNAKSFFKKRILRLYPELWGGVLLSVITLLVLYINQINWLPFVVWIFTQSTVFQFWTPDCLRGFGCGTPNGSLWTISVMVQCYIAMWILHKFLRGKSSIRWVFLLLIGIVTNILTPHLNFILPELLVKLFEQTFLPYIWIFVLGALICEKFDVWRQFLMKYWFVFLFLSAIASFSGYDFGVYGTIKVLCLAPALIGFAYKYPRLTLKYDISYGIYIYHMVVINVFIELGFIERYIYILLTLMITIVLAIISSFTLGGFYKKGKYNLERLKSV